MEVKELFKVADFKIPHGMIFNNDCMKVMRELGGAV